MFTGIVEELGECVDVAIGDDSGRLTVRGSKVTGDAAHGDSIAVNGVCLTVTNDPDEALSDGLFTVDVMPETLQRTALRALRSGERVNLERAVRAADRLGGHIVQGHVDDVGVVEERTPGERWDVVRIGMSDELSRYVVEKGSIAVDGVSLTVSAVHDANGTGRAAFEISLIPTTLDLTTLGVRQPGDPVNLEVDVIAKYVERLVRP